MVYRPVLYYTKAMTKQPLEPSCNAETQLNQQFESRLALLRASSLKAVETLIKHATSEDSPPRLRAKAKQILLQLDPAHYDHGSDPATWRIAEAAGIQPNIFVGGPNEDGTDRDDAAGTFKPDD